MATAEELLQAHDDVFSDGERRGMMYNFAEDDQLDGHHVTVDGRRMVTFGSCSYLGLETEPAMKSAVIDAATRYGTQFSSGRAYIAAPLYRDAEAVLSALFERPALITPSTSLGHMAALPVLVGARDCLVIDHQTHYSVQTAAKLVQAQGSPVTLVPHGDVDRLESTIVELARTHRRVWYATDGLFSMYADYAPAAVIDALMRRYEQLWLYADDAHSVSWSGRHGRGYLLDRLSPEAAERAVVAGSLNKSFAASGGVFTFPDAELKRWVLTVGGPMVFSGPVQPPMLGAILASARLHLTDAVAPRRAHLIEMIRLFNNLAVAAGLPLVSPSEAPIRCIGGGVPEIAYNVTARLREAGYFINTAIYPAVAAKRCGSRIAINANHTAEDIAGVVEALTDALPRALADEGSSVEALEQAFARQLGGRRVTLRRSAAPPPVLRLERHVTIETVSKPEWDTLFAGRGSFTWDGLRSVEEVFATPRGEPENDWVFNYWIVRSDDGRPVAATFFTTALWKDDMISPANVSAEVERQRATDPYYLTSTMVAMGCLVTEGDHLYLDRSADWRGALRLILAAARDEEERADASAIVLRDLPDGDVELHDFLVAEGFVRMPMWTSWVRELDFDTDAEFLAGLKAKARLHRRKTVLAWQDHYRVETVTGGSDAAARISAADRDHLYQLYRNVHARNVEINVFPLPRRLLDALLDSECWELLLLRLPEAADRPVAFALTFVGSDFAQPLFAGLDYDYVASHHCYQQLLWQAIKAAQRRGARRVLLGMSADLQKSRFGATPQRRWVYLQPTEDYQAAVLTHLAEQVAVAA